MFSSVIQKPFETIEHSGTDEYDVECNANEDVYSECTKGASSRALILGGHRCVEL